MQEQLEPQVSKEEIQEELDGICEDTTRDEMIGIVRFMARQLDLALKRASDNDRILMEALEQAQTKYKKLEEKTWKKSAKLFIKKVLIGWGWYEASQKELEDIHFGKA